MARSQVTEAFPWSEASHLIRDRDSTFGSPYTFDAMGIRDCGAGITIRVCGEKNRAQSSWERNSVDAPGLEPGPPCSRHLLTAAPACTKVKKENSGLRWPPGAVVVRGKSLTSRKTGSDYSDGSIAVAGTCSGSPALFLISKSHPTMLMGTTSAH